MDDSLGTTTRRARRRQRLGPEAQCGCGERDPIVLQRTEVGVECAACQAHRTTGKRTERHHPAGRGNWPVTVGLDANTHARLTDAQQDWPIETLRNPQGGEARRLAALLRASMDGVRLVVLPALVEVEELVGWLEALEAPERRP